MKKKTKTYYKDKAWKAFSTYIRTRDSIKTTGGVDFCRCITCKKIYEYKQTQAGHFVPGRSNSVLFKEDIVNGQCLTEESLIELTDGSKKSIKHINVGDRLLAFNDKTFKKEESVVESVRSFTPEELYKVEMDDGRIFWATKDHLVVANGKWTSIGEMLQGFTDYDILEL